MKKTLSIQLANTEFTLHEDAFRALETYLSSIATYFEAEKSKREIIEDIEARIAEQLVDSKEPVVTIGTIEHIIAQMGSVSEFEDTESLPQSFGKEKRLFRDPVHGVFAGVCAGIAAYFGMSVNMVRIIFVLLMFASGISVFIYLLLWISIPTAQTTSERLQMNGEPVTLATLHTLISAGQRGTPRKFNIFIDRCVTLLVTITRWLAGSGLVVVSGISILTLLVASGFLISGTSWLNKDIPVEALLPGIKYWIVFPAFIVGFLIPLFSMFIAGLTLLMKRVALSGRSALILLGLWLLTLIVSGFGIAEIIKNYETYQRTNPALQQETKQTELAEHFSKIVIDGLSVTLVLNPSTSTISETGKVRDLGGYRAEINNDVLTLSEVPREKENCLTCSRKTTALTLSVPSISSIDVKNNGAIHSSVLRQSEPLYLTVDGAYANLQATLTNLTVFGGNNAYIELSGEAASTTITAHSHTHVNASDLESDHVVARSEQFSTVHVWALDTLDARALGGSSLYYLGSPKLTKQTGERSTIGPE